MDKMTDRLVLRWAGVELPVLYIFASVTLVFRNIPQKANNLIVYVHIYYVQIYYMHIYYMHYFLVLSVK